MNLLYYHHDLIQLHFYYRIVRHSSAHRLQPSELKRENKLAFLLLFADVEEKFQHQITVICERTLEPLDTFHTLGIRFVIQTAIQTFFHNLVHPAGIQEREFSLLGDLLEEAV